MSLIANLLAPWFGGDNPFSNPTPSTGGVDTSYYNSYNWSQVAQSGLGIVAIGAGALLLYQLSKKF
jgi:hypothetical protein